MLKRLVTLMGVVLVGVGIILFRHLLPLEYSERTIALGLLIMSLTIFYTVSSIFLKRIMLRAGAREGETGMILNVVKFILIFAGAMVMITYWFSLGAIGALFAAFGGMFLGWSLQGAISGLAAWFLTSLLRPFSVGDRLQLPSYGLVGDVISVSPLYTTLNQVGGSVGSEEPAHRTVLIPNAMLFGTLVINYTPKDQDKLIEQFREKLKTAKTSDTSYMLDEFVLRITFDSDWAEAERILLNAAREVTGDIIKATGEQPYIRADMSDWYGVFMRLRFMTLATERPKIMYELTKRIFNEIQSSDKVDMAIPYIYSYKKGGQPNLPYDLEK